MIIAHQMTYEPETWKKAYEEDGFVIVQDLVDPATRCALCSTIEKVTSHPQDLPSHLKEKLFLERDHVRNNPNGTAAFSLPKSAGTALGRLLILPRSILHSPN
jgi:hypothetical protein